MDWHHRGLIVAGGVRSHGATGASVGKETDKAAGENPLWPSGESEGVGSEGPVGVDKTLMKGPGFVAGLKGAARNASWSSVPLNRPRLSRAAQRAMRRGRSSCSRFSFAVQCGGIAVHHGTSESAVPTLGRKCGDSESCRPGERATKPQETRELIRGVRGKLMEVPGPCDV